VAKSKEDFVPLSSLSRAPRDPRTTLAEIRRIYFKTTRQTVQHDIAHAIALLKTLPTEEDREKATVYMEGLAALRSEWGARRAKR
jgi:hypothetical protein